MTQREKAGGGLTESGELGLIQYIRQRASTTRNGRGQVRLGIGDDCAILQPRPGEEIVVTTDFCLESRHFRRDWHPPASAGHRALARGLSDLAAMGARPVAAFLSLALPRTAASDKVWIAGFFDGLLQLARRAAVPLAGGDTAEAPGRHILADVVLVGAVPAGKALRRDGARPGDRIFCTGALGGAAAELKHLARARGAAAELKHLARGRRAPLPGDFGDPQLYPEPRLTIGQMLRTRDLATACIDISDGLSTDLHHLCAASRVSAEVVETSLPLHPLAALARRRGKPDGPLMLALHGGEDYELLFTVRGDSVVPRSFRGVALTEIGRMKRRDRTKPTVTLVRANGEQEELPAGGWEHLR